MKTLKELMEAIEERFGCKCDFESDGKTVLLETDSPAGQDVIHEFTIPENSENPAEAYLANLKENAAYYDPDEEASYWIDSSGHGKNGAPYRLTELVKEMEWVGDFYTDVARFAEKFMDGKVVPPLYKSLSGRRIEPKDFIIMDDNDAFQWEDATEDRDGGWNVELFANCNVDELFGTNVETDENDAYLNIYAHVDAALSYIYPYLTVVYNEDGSPHDYEEYERSLSDYEQAALLSYVQEHVGNLLIQMSAHSRKRMETAKNGNL